MPTFSALTTTENKDAAAALGDALELLDPSPTGIGVIELEDGSGLWEVGGYFEDRPDGVILDLLAATHNANPFVVSEVPDIDWVAHVRRELSPVSAGRFFVYGSHDDDKVPEESVSLLIEAAMAFGTGHHGTTQGCLRALDKLLSESVRPSRVADIGCGTAVLAMAAAKVLPDAEVVAGDIDEVAVEVAVANVAANDLTGRILCCEATGFGHAALDRLNHFDLIFANILKSPLIDLAPDMSRHISRGGSIILSGILNEQAEEVVAAYAQVGLELSDRFSIGDWTTLVVRKL